MVSLGAKLVRFVPAAGWAWLIFWLSSRERPVPLPVLLPGADKVAHALVFGILCQLLLVASRAHSTRGTALWVVVTAIYGASDEVHQRFVPGRTADMLDLLADVSGALVVAALWLRRRGNNEPEPR